MDLLLHTICLEPARWTPQRVSQSLPDLIPGIAAAGFTQVEIYEPHLADPGQWEETKASLESHGITPLILSSYADFGPNGLSDAAAAEAFIRIGELVRFFDLRAVRLFPAPRVDPDDATSIAAFVERTRDIAARMPATQFLLETHDGSIADHPQRIVEVVKSIALPNVGLLFQPTVFDDARAQAQFDLQRPFIRHVHLQNRKPVEGFELLEKGTVRWERILRNLLPGTAASLEFVPRGICPEADFQLAAVLKEAESERKWVESILV
ncbi:hypothetical protein BH09VER1_BH09VER1_19630 [soil metagenome]